MRYACTIRQITGMWRAARRLPTPELCARVTAGRWPACVRTSSVSCNHPVAGNRATSWPCQSLPRQLNGDVERCARIARPGWTRRVRLRSRRSLPGGVARHTPSFLHNLISTSVLSHAWSCQPEICVGRTAAHYRFKWCFENTQQANSGYFHAYCFQAARQIAPCPVDMCAAVNGGTRLLRSAE